MESRQTSASHRSQDFLDTVAFGSMLVFASVMPPLTQHDATTTRTERAEPERAGKSRDGNEAHAA